MKQFLAFFTTYVLGGIVLLGAGALLIYLFIFSPHIVDGHSMDPTFANGEIYLANEFSYKFSKPQRGDVIVFVHSATQNYIKRIIGLPGDTVMLTDGEVSINGQQLTEPYVSPGNLTTSEDFLQEGQSIVVPQGEYFVLGDNREGSSDSREWGFVQFSAIQGKVFLVIWPLNDFQYFGEQTY